MERPFDLVGCWNWTGGIVLDVEAKGIKGNLANGFDARLQTQFINTLDCGTTAPFYDNGKG